MFVKKHFWMCTKTNEPKQHQSHKDKYKRDINRTVGVENHNCKERIILKESNDAYQNLAFEWTKVFVWINCFSSLGVTHVISKGKMDAYWWLKCTWLSDVRTILGFSDSMSQLLDLIINLNICLTVDNHIKFNQSYMYKWVLQIYTVLPWIFYHYCIGKCLYTGNFAHKLDDLILTMVSKRT